MDACNNSLIIPPGYVAVAVGILFNANGQVLVAERTKNRDYAGYWEFPGGKIETNEAPINALKRELNEELGIEVLQAVNLFHFAYAYPTRNVWLDIWRVENYRGEVFGRENQALAWVNESEIKSLNLLIANQAIVKRIFSENK